MSGLCRGPTGLPSTITLSSGLHCKVGTPGRAISLLAECSACVPGVPEQSGGNGLPCALSSLGLVQAI